MRSTGTDASSHLHFMVFKSETLIHIYEKLKREWPSIESFPGGDQVWIYSPVGAGFIS